MAHALMAVAVPYFSLQYPINRLPIGDTHMKVNMYMLIARHLYSSWTKCCILLFAVDTIAIIQTQ